MAACARCLRSRAFDVEWRREPARCRAVTRRKVSSALRNRATPELSQRTDQGDTRLRHRSYEQTDAARRVSLRSRRFCGSRRHAADREISFPGSADRSGTALEVRRVLPDAPGVITVDARQQPLTDRSPARGSYPLGGDAYVSILARRTACRLGQDRVAERPPRDFRRGLGYGLAAN
jgi:hypothetical protein